MKEVNMVIAEGCKTPKIHFVPYTPNALRDGQKFGEFICSHCPNDFITGILFELVNRGVIHLQKVSEMENVLRQTKAITNDNQNDSDRSGS